MESSSRYRHSRFAAAILAALALLSIANAQHVALKGQNDRLLSVAEDLILTSSGGKKNGQAQRSNTQIAVKKSRGAENGNGKMKQNSQRGGTKKNRNGGKNKKRGSRGRNQKKMKKRGTWSGSYKRKNKKGRWWGSSTQGKARKNAGKSGKGQKPNWSGSTGRKKNRNQWNNWEGSGKSGKETHHFYSHWQGTYHPTEFPVRSCWSLAGSCFWK